MSSTQITITVIVVVVGLILAAGIVFARRRRVLKARFGPEYDRVVAERDNRGGAERELRARQRRHADFDLRPLDPVSRQRHVAAWEEIQVRFVDAPDRAVGQADGLVIALMAERGYPTDGFDQQAADLSVDHARTLGHYRQAHDIHQANQRGEATTEQLRQALVHYRTLVADLLGTEPAESSYHASAADTATDREAHPDASRHPSTPAEPADRH